MHHGTKNEVMENKKNEKMMLTVIATLIAFSSNSYFSSALSSEMVHTPRSLVRIAEPVWRNAAKKHADEIQRILQPGLTAPDHPLNSGRKRKHGNRQKQTTDYSHAMTALDPEHPVYNFLIEYYGLKGLKGPKRLARWSPDPALMLMLNQETDQHQITIESSSELKAPIDFPSTTRSNTECGILLEGANEDDLGSGVLYLKGAIPIESSSSSESGGVLYSPSAFYKSRKNNQLKSSKGNDATPFLWYRSILQNTLAAEPVLHCHGLHEWAMQYQPEGAPPPPSAKYQSHMSLRVSQDTINHAVERRGISCTHVDALRYFAPAAGPLNRHGASLERSQQLELEQPACVHAHMDLLKISLKLNSFVDSNLIRKCLETALEARRLDVAASPYDPTPYGVEIIPIETKEGRAQYRSEQTELMERAEPVRKRLLNAYDTFLSLAFDEQMVQTAEQNPAAERFAKTEPGGLPYRKNLIEQP